MQSGAIKIMTLNDEQVKTYVRVIKIVAADAQC